MEFYLDTRQETAAVELLRVRFVVRVLTGAHTHGNECMRQRRSSLILCAGERALDCVISLLILDI